MSAAGAEHLLSPADVGPVRLRNRVVSTSHQTSLVHDHLPTADLHAYHEARARGGVGAIFLEATAVHPTGLLTPHTVGGFLPEITGAYERLGDTIRRHGARLFVQLFHGGREQISSAPRAPAVAPSAVPSLRFKSEPRALTAAEIAEIIAGYGTAARLAAQGGVDGLEVSVSHGYLPAQFLSVQSNRRTDRYGGSPEGRLRFVCDVLQAVRDSAGPDLAVGARISADERVPGGLGPQESAEVAAALQAAGLVDFLSLVLGHSADPAASTWIAPPPPVPAGAISGPAAAIRRAVPGATLLATTRLVDIAAADALVASGAADLVGMTRALIADPELVAKTAAGRSDAVIECVGCNQSCIGHYHAGLPIGCAVNPRTGRERTLAALPSRPGRPRGGTATPSAGRRTVLVIGAGPAGIAAALEASAHGAIVTLVERADRIGGQLWLAGRAPAHTEMWDRYERSVRARLEAAGIAVTLGTEAGVELAAEHATVVLASGARPYLPAVGAHSSAVTDAWTVIADPGSVTGPALVADWGGGWDGLDAAERLAVAGTEVTLACAAPVPGETLHQYQRNLYLQRLDELDVAILHHQRLRTDGDRPSLAHVFSGRPSALPATATLVLAQGRVPEDRLWESLQANPDARRAGDVLGPRTLEEAVLEGTLAGAPTPPHPPHAAAAAAGSA